MTQVPLLFPLPLPAHCPSQCSLSPARHLSQLPVLPLLQFYLLLLLPSQCHLPGNSCSCFYPSCSPLAASMAPTAPTPSPPPGGSSTRPSSRISPRSRPRRRPSSRRSQCRPRRGLPRRRRCSAKIAAPPPIPRWASCFGLLGGGGGGDHHHHHPKKPSPSAAKLALASFLGRSRPAASPVPATTRRPSRLPSSPCPSPDPPQQPPDPQPVPESRACKPRWRLGRPPVPPPLLPPPRRRGRHGRCGCRSGRLRASPWWPPACGGLRGRRVDGLQRAMEASLEAAPWICERGWPTGGRDAGGRRGAAEERAGATRE
ncbi:hypothetical protein SETIT_1G299700v2 [Setaria italica]|uniref:Uncharacterized protein n=1 Tax=Setaria italica TaxID=4555 RepID=A0A368PT12_SETIT|nr:hypothetical protein SETIT_1G299700v2 [Setaria italica]